MCARFRESIAAVQSASQRVLITAGGAGIGRAIAEAFLDSGATIHIADIDSNAVAKLRLAHEGIGASVAD